MKSVSENKIDVLVSKSIKLNPCECGNGHGEIVIMIPWYGATGAKCRCSNCGRETKVYGISTTLISDTRIATPIIDRSLIKGIRNAVNDWNKRM